MTPSSLVPRRASATCPVRCVLSSIKPAVCGRPALYGKIASVFSSTGTGGGRNKPLPRHGRRWPTTA